MSCMFFAAARSVADWPQIPSDQQIGFATWIDVDANDVVYVFRRCPVRCSDGAHPGEDDPPGSMWMFDSSGGFIGEWPQQGPHGIAKEGHGLHVDRDGNIWTTDVMLHDVKKFAPDGTLLMTLGKTGVPGEGPDTFNKPTQTFVDGAGNIFVTDGYGNQRIVKLDHDGRFVMAWGTEGTGPGEFRLPHSVTQDSTGRLIVADRCGLGATGCTDGRVQIFDADGVFLDQWTPPDGGPFTPNAVDADAEGRVYIGDAQNRRIWVIESQTGEVIETVEGVSVHGMSVSSSGDDIYVSGGSGVGRYTRNASP
jgi:peptidylamidoglycolate lyase